MTTPCVDFQNTVLRSLQLFVYHGLTSLAKRVFLLRLADSMSKIDDILLESFTVQKFTHAATIFPLVSVVCTECFEEYKNLSSEFQTIGYYHEVMEDDFRWFCSMICVLRHQKKEEGLEALANLDIT